MAYLASEPVEPSPFRSFASSVFSQPTTVKGFFLSCDEKQSESALKMNPEGGHFEKLIINDIYDDVYV